MLIPPNPKCGNAQPRGQKCAISPICILLFNVFRYWIMLTGILENRRYADGQVPDSRALAYWKSVL